MTIPDAGVRVEPGSFRDPANRVFYADGAVLRGLDAGAAEHWRALHGSGFFPELVAAGKICGTEPVDPTPFRAPDGAPWAAVLRHERVPFVSHPYEWSFGMLRDAALLHLEILRAALAAGFTIKDGSAYNLQWHGVRPVFIDVGSFEPARDGEPWAGYRQFCQTLLYPLLLTAHLGVDFQPWLRAQVDGIAPEQMRRLFTGTRRLLPGVPTHVHLHSAMQQRHAAATTSDVRAQLRTAGYSRELALTAVRRIERLVRRLAPRHAPSHWADYRRTCTYSPGDRVAKERFVAAALSAGPPPGLVLDLGANDGRYARLAARHAGYVVAVEQDPAVVDQVYAALRAEEQRRVLPLVLDLADPSPGGGWRGVERAAFGTRARADVVLALAVVHHLAIGRNVPLAQIVDQLADACVPGGRLLVEFVHPEDPMARRLLANKPPGLFGDYRPDQFARLLAARCRIAHRAELPSGTRTLYEAVVGG